MCLMFNVEETDPDEQGRPRLKGVPLFSGHSLFAARPQRFLAEKTTNHISFYAPHLLLPLLCPRERGFL